MCAQWGQGNGGVWGWDCGCVNKVCMEVSWCGEGCVGVGVCLGCSWVSEFWASASGIVHEYSVLNSIWPKSGLSEFFFFGGGKKRKTPHKLHVLPRSYISEI